jgi:hypothetical protein
MILVETVHKLINVGLTKIREAEASYYSASYGRQACLFGCVVGRKPRGVKSGVHYIASLYFWAQVRKHCRTKVPQVITYCI